MLVSRHQFVGKCESKVKKCVQKGIKNEIKKRQKQRELAIVSQTGSKDAFGHGF